MAPARVESPEARASRVFEGFVEFSAMKRAVNLGETRFAFSFVRRIILVHYIDVGVA